MSITLELSPELEAQLRADANAQRVPIESLAVEKLNGLYSDKREEAAQKRREAAAAGFGMFAGHGLSVDEFLDARHAEAQSEAIKDGL